ncbi:MAG TPA: hypothetical protein VG917_01195 [Patescibacteria group bacterium]|nr:hypothetical protein [Patescibacteria group bacterium]
MKSKLLPFLFPILLILITSVICYLNYTPGTYLTGWDTLHPEFNFSQQAQNEIFGAFRTDQGLGAVAAHAHMSELPRLGLLWIEHFFLPLSFLRYSIIFLCFILGPLGVYFFAKYILDKSFPKYSREAAFLGALVYIFNLATVQQFYLPFEMFMVQYAALGFLFLFALKYLEKPKAGTLLVFAIITLLASPMAYASVLWYAYFAAFLLFLGFVWILNRNKKVFISAVILTLVTLLVNAYWMLPNFYFLLTAANNVSLAQINQIFSDEAFLHNKEYGDIVDTAILKNFLFDWQEQLDVNTAQEVMVFWKIHLANISVLIIGYLTFFITLAGIGVSFVKKNKAAIAVIPIFILGFVMLINMNPPFEFFFSYLRDNFSLFKEGLRFPFTKFSILLEFGFGVFFAFAIAEGLKYIDQVAKPKFKNIASVGAVLIVATSLLWYGAPMFAGKLIDPQLRIAIPKEYFDFFAYMKDKPESARIAPLPLHSLWGWEYDSWGYQGAGFLWFGVKQPVLARDFDRWNPSNEQYLREMSAAIYSRDVAQVESLAKKYRISYFVLDQNTIFPGNKQNALWYYETKDTFSKSPDIKLAKKFGNIYVYKVSDSLVGSGYIQAPKTISTVGPKITGGFVDMAAKDLGDYVNSDQPTYSYPSRELVGRYDRIDPKKISYLDNKLIIKVGDNSGNTFTNSWLSNDIFPAFMQSNNYDLSLEEKGLPYTVGDNTYISVPVSAPPVNVAQNIQDGNCLGLGPDAISKMDKIGNSVRFTARDGSSCGYIDFASEKQDFGSILITEINNVEGLPIRLCISDRLTSRCGIYTALDEKKGWQRYVFMIPPQPSGATGYAVHFNTVGIGNQTSINEVRYVHFIQIPYYRIENLSFVKPGFEPIKSSISSITSRQVNPTFYEVKASLDSTNPGLIELFKAYNPGWKAYDMTNTGGIKSSLPFLFNKEIKTHVLVNNWANGWVLDGSKKSYNITIVYLPQYLEYIGLIMLVFIFTLLPILSLRDVIKHHKGKHHHSSSN